MNFLQDFAHPMAKFPAWIMRLKFSHVADPPDMIADAIGFFVAPIQLFAADFFAHCDGLQHGTVTVPAAANVIDLSATRRANEFGKRLDQIEAVDIVAHLFALVAKHAIRSAVDRADHQIRKETVEFRGRMRRSR